MYSGEHSDSHEFEGVSGTTKTVIKHFTLQGDVAPMLDAPATEFAFMTLRPNQQLKSVTDIVVPGLADEIKPATINASGSLWGPSTDGKELIGALGWETVQVSTFLMSNRDISPTSIAAPLGCRR